MMVHDDGRGLWKSVIPNAHKKAIIQQKINNQRSQMKRFALN